MTYDGDLNPQSLYRVTFFRNSISIDCVVEVNEAEEGWDDDVIVPKAHDYLCAELGLRNMFFKYGWDWEVSGPL